MQIQKNRITADCSFRAISTALGQDYNTTVMEMAEMMCKTGYALNDSKGEEKYLESKGWTKHCQPRKSDGMKYTGKEWCGWLNRYAKGWGNIVCHIGGHHTVAIIKKDGQYKVYDTWDSTDGCIGNYWTK